MEMRCRKSRSATQNILVEIWGPVLRLDDPDKPRAGTWLQETNL